MVAFLASHDTGAPEVLWSLSRFLRKLAFKRKYQVLRILQSLWGRGSARQSGVKCANIVHSIEQDYCGSTGSASISVRICTAGMNGLAVFKSASAPYLTASCQQGLEICKIEVQRVCASARGRRKRKLRATWLH